MVKNEFGEIIDREGGVGLNAFTSADETGYFFSLPANKLELWAYLESERFLEPVFREFYKERDVVQEERRMRTESQPIGRLIEQFLAAAFTAHPYGQPVVGWHVRPRQPSPPGRARASTTSYYVPSNMTVAIVGDVKAAEVLPAGREVLRPAAGRAPSPSRCARSSRRSRSPSGRWCSRTPRSRSTSRATTGRPSTDPDDAVYDAIADLLSSGRTSRLYRSLVRDKKIAAAAAGFGGFPGDKYPNLFVVLRACRRRATRPRRSRPRSAPRSSGCKTEDVTRRGARRWSRRGPRPT